MSAYFDVSLEQFTLGCNGACIAAVGVGSLLFNVLAVKFGKRPIYLATSVGLFVTSFWAAEAKSFGSLVAARTIQGLCMAPMEALIPASIADIWFVHERGYRSAIFNLGILGGINLASPIGEYQDFHSFMHHANIEPSWGYHPIRFLSDLSACHGWRLCSSIPHYVLLDAGIRFPSG